jgi:homoserine dehydrogenase
VRQIRLAIVGFGTVGQGLAAAIHARRAWLEAECDAAVSLVSIATRRAGFLHHEAGFDIPALLAAGRSPREDRAVRHWPSALAGLADTACDVLAETSNTNPREPEPALTHIRHALTRRSHVITSSKGACAAAAVELLALARRHGVLVRMESTVMSGTPVLSTLRDGLAGVRVIAMTGILNATANHILTLMTAGRSYPVALADAQSRGYAEPDPSDDVDGHDVVAKARILAALGFGCSLSLDQVARRGVADLAPDDIAQAARDGRRVKLVASLRSAGPALASVEARVEPVALPLSDPLARVDGVANALTIDTDPVGRVTIVGPGAGRELAGQGVFADLVAIVRAPH